MENLKSQNFECSWLLVVILPTSSVHFKQFCIYFKTVFIPVTASSSTVSLVNNDVGIHNSRRLRQELYTDGYNEWDLSTTSCFFKDLKHASYPVQAEIKTCNSVQRPASIDPQRKNSQASYNRQTNPFLIKLLLLWTNEQKHCTFCDCLFYKISTLLRMRFKDTIDIHRLLQVLVKIMWLQKCKK